MQPFADDTHCTIFEKTTGRPQRMERGAAHEQVKKNPLRFSFDPWCDVQDHASGYEIPADWREMKEPQLRELHARLRLPRGSKWSGECLSGGHITNVRFDLEQRYNRRRLCALGMVAR